MYLLCVRWMRLVSAGDGALLLSIAGRLPNDRVRRVCSEILRFCVPGGATL
jgi:hypothetical protein